MSTNLKQDISIGKNLKSIRKKNGLTQNQVSAQLEVRGLPVSPDILAKMEQGKYSIRVSVLLALKQIYKLESFDEFFKDI